jgi:hypothetical protein
MKTQQQRLDEIDSLLNRVENSLIEVQEMIKVEESLEIVR